MKILLTGGAGYIGSHTAVELLNANHEIIIVDNLSNSKREAVVRVEEITGKTAVFYQADIRDKAALHTIFTQEQPDAVIHFAGLKAVGESVEKPMLYYQNNVGGTLNLCEVMVEHGVKNLVFSSSCTVYGDPATVPITENSPIGATTNPYGRSKFMIEEILRDLYVADQNWNIALLRYFNPVGAHSSGKIGEDPNGIPNNLFPYIAQVAIGKLPYLRVFGDDFPTDDGTGVRDYIHVVDLAQGHLKAIDKLGEQPGLVTYNLGTGTGYSVLDIVNAFGKACGQEIAYEIHPRRAGDIAMAYADPRKAADELDWTAVYSLEDMCADAWRWQTANPNGYAE